MPSQKQHLQNYAGWEPPERWTNNARATGATGRTLEEVEKGMRIVPRNMRLRELEALQDRGQIQVQWSPLTLHQDGMITEEQISVHVRVGDEELSECAVEAPTETLVARVQMAVAFNPSVPRPKFSGATGAYGSGGTRAYPPMGHSARSNIKRP